MIYRDHFQVGGTLESNHSSYVIRQADRQLLNYLEKGDFCFVLNCRQMGKSSLMIKTADRLRTKNISCTFSDISILGTCDVSPEQWYKSFAYQLLESLDLDDLDLDAWWLKNNSLTAIDCLGKIFQDIILAEIPTNIVIFIDEIDSIIKLPFKDDFFALIRGCYNKRTINDDYKRLTFCLLGVATPPDLIEDKVRTPFNIGHPIDLVGFTAQEAKTALIPGFPRSIEQPETILKEVIAWTGGQPFLTQKLCQLIAQYADSSHPSLEKIIKQYMIDDWESQDHPQHFRTIRDRLLYDQNNILKVLEIYQQILKGEKIIVDDSLAQSQLRLSGIVVKKEKYLQVYNPIYKQIFDRHWILEQLNNLRPYSIQFNKWLSSNYSEDYLLNPEDLDRALQWARDKDLTSEDYKYLSASREHEKEKVIQAKNKLIRRRVILSSTAILLISIFALISWFDANKKNREAVISNLNNNSSMALEKFKQGQQLIGLIEAIKINHNFKNKLEYKNGLTLAEYLTTKPISTANNIINQIKEKNVVRLSQSSITYLAYNPDRQTIIAGDENGIVKLWNTKEQKIIDWKNLKNQQKITGIVINPQSNRIYFASPTEDGGILVVNFAGQLENIFETNSKITSLAIDLKSNNIISGDDLGKIMLWSQDGQKIKTWSAHKEQINSIAIAPSNNSIATASNDSTVKLWTTEGKSIATLAGKEGHKDSVNNVIFSPDGKTIATASKDTTIKLWNTDGNVRRTLLGHDGSVNSMAFSSDGQTIASVSNDRTIKLWNRMGVLRATIVGHQSAVNQIIFNSRNRTFISADKNGKVKIWQNLSATDNRIETGIFFNERQLLVSKPQVSQIQSFDHQIDNIIPNPQNKFINAIAIDRRQKILIAGTEDGFITRLDLQQFDVWQTWQQNSYNGAIIAVDIHPTNNNLITLGVEKSGNSPSYTIKQWNQNGDLIKTFERDENKQITAIKYSPQGDRIAVATKQGKIELWDAQDNAPKIVLDNLTQKDITAISFSPNGQIIATGDREGTIQLRSINNKLLTTLTKNDGHKIVHLEFTADGNTVRAIDSYSTISSWHLNINPLIQKGCDWLEDYFAMQNDDREIEQICSH